MDMNWENGRADVTVSTLVEHLGLLKVFLKVSGVADCWELKSAVELVGLKDYI